MFDIYQYVKVAASEYMLVCMYVCMYVVVGYMYINGYIYVYVCHIYIVYTVGRSIADTSELRQHVHQGAKRRSKYTAEVVYRGYRPTYRAIYTI